jgi:hypothetical protein
MTNIAFNQPFVSEGLVLETFQQFETILLKGCTGTGKTTAVAQHIQKYTVPQVKFLSKANRASLADQHEKGPESLGTQSYQDVKASLQDSECLTMCHNSLIKLGGLDDKEIANHIIYVDELSSFTEFTNNDLLDNR